jgi:hypothetical protein
METSIDALLKAVIKALYIVANRRTTTKIAGEALSSVIQSLKEKYQFFKDIDINEETFFNENFNINFNNEIIVDNKTEIAHAIESLIRLVYDDLTDNARMYFVTEMKNHLDNQTLYDITECGVDLDQIQIEQNHAFLRSKKKKRVNESRQKENLLGYNWGNVSNWEYKEANKSVELYDDNGKIIDRIDLEKAIQNYVEILSGITETDTIRMQEIIKKHEKEYYFLKLIYEDNVSIVNAQKMLNINEEEINDLIKRLIQLEMLKYSSKDTIELTNIGKQFLTKE